MKNLIQRRNKVFTSNLIHNTFEEAVEKFKECEVLVSKISTIDKPYFQHNNQNPKISIDKVPVWLLKNYC
jgi:hypothetical protein